MDGQGQLASLLLQAVADVEGWADEGVRPESLESASETAEALSHVDSYYYACYDPSWGPVDHDLIATCEAARAVSEASADGPGVQETAASAARALARSRCQAEWGEDADGEDPTEVTAQCYLLRDIFGNPFRPRYLKPAWRTSTVLVLAHAANDNRVLPAGTLELDRLMVLADALDEAGCDNADILEHLREPAPHVRGCWVIDLLLNKS